MPGLVHRDRLLLLGQQHVGALAPAEQYAVPGVVEVGRGQYLALVADGEDSRLVGEVGQVRPGEAGRAARDDVQVHVGTELLVAAVHSEDRGSLVERGQRDYDLAVEPAWPQ